MLPTGWKGARLLGGRVSVGWVVLTVPRVEATSPARQAALLTEKHLPSEHLWVCSILQCFSGPLLTSSSTPCQTRPGQPAHHRVPGKPCHDARQPALNGQCVEGVAHLLLRCSLRAIPGHVNQDEIRDQHDPSYIVPCLPRQSLRRGELLVRLCVPFSKACGGFPPDPPPHPHVIACSPIQSCCTAHHSRSNIVSQPHV